MAASSSPRERFRTLAENLLSLEINTIVKPQITAQKMPVPEHTLIDIANLYRDALRGYVLELPAPARDALGSSPARAAFSSVLDGEQDRRASLNVFDEIRTVAQCISTNAGARAVLSEEKLQLVSRIWDNSDQLKGIFERLGAQVVLERGGGKNPLEIELEPPEIVVLRKIWEVGLEVVLVQSVIQLDGDVFTRVQENRVAAKNLSIVLDVHDRAIHTSVRFWTHLVELVGTLAKGFVELVLRPK
jgi:hypothetical protein